MRRFWPSKDELRVDQSQYDALLHALTSELAIIQGPPGAFVSTDILYAPS